MLACYQMSHTTFILLKRCQVRICMAYNGWSNKYILKTCFRNTFRGAARNKKNLFLAKVGPIFHYQISELVEPHDKITL